MIAEKIMRSKGEKKTKWRHREQGEAMEDLQEDEHQCKCKIAQGTNKKE